MGVGLMRHHDIVAHTMALTEGLLGAWAHHIIEHIPEESNRFCVYFDDIDTQWRRFAWNVVTLSGAWIHLAESTQSQEQFEHNVGRITSEFCINIQNLGEKYTTKDGYVIREIKYQSNDKEARGRKVCHLK